MRHSCPYSTKPPWHNLQFDLTAPIFVGIYSCYLLKCFFRHKNVFFWLNCLCFTVILLFHQCNVDLHVVQKAPCQHFPTCSVVLCLPCSLQTPDPSPNRSVPNALHSEAGGKKAKGKRRRRMRGNWGCLFSTDPLKNLFTFYRTGLGTTTGPGWKHNCASPRQAFMYGWMRKGIYYVSASLNR